ncbi:hypothetical protein ACQCX2_01160 [Propionibacteriaceae bacterium Y1700]|uniref:hypothetical protein n=1 Tax=Microlunatus sp. Y1700 TaxID=3418487 RepID=UPI003DA71E12
MGLGDLYNSAKDKVSDAADTVTDAVSDTTDAVTDTVSDVVEGTTDFVVETGENFLSGAEKLAEGAGDVLGGIWDGVTSLADRITDWLGGAFDFLTDFIVNWIKQAFENLKKLIESVVGTAKDIFRGVMAPKTLSEMAQQWRDGPVKSLTGLEAQISDTALQANDGWASAAGASYARNIPPQGAAVGAMAGLAEGTAVALTDTAKALETYYAEALGITGRIYAAINGNPGSLFSLGTLLELVGGGAGTLWARLKAIADFAKEMKRIQDDLADNVTASGAFPDSKWPSAVAF